MDRVVAMAAQNAPPEVELPLFDAPPFIDPLRSAATGINMTLMEWGQVRALLQLPDRGGTSNHADFLGPFSDENTFDEEDLESGTIVVLSLDAQFDVLFGDDEAAITGLGRCIIGRVLSGRNHRSGPVYVVDAFSAAGFNADGTRFRCHRDGHFCDSFHFCAHGRGCTSLQSFHHVESYAVIKSIRHLDHRLLHPLVEDLILRAKDVYPEEVMRTLYEEWERSKAAADAGGGGGAGGGGDDDDDDGFGPAIGGAPFVQRRIGLVGGKGKGKGGGKNRPPSPDRLNRAANKKLREEWLAEDFAARASLQNQGDSYAAKYGFPGSKGVGETARQAPDRPRKELTHHKVFFPADEASEAQETRSKDPKAKLAGLLLEALGGKKADGEDALDDHEGVETVKLLNSEGKLTRCPRPVQFLFGARDRPLKPSEVGVTDLTTLRKHHQVRNLHMTSPGSYTGVVYQALRERKHAPAESYKELFSTRLTSCIDLDNFKNANDQRELKWLMYCLDKVMLGEISHAADALVGRLSAVLYVAKKADAGKDRGKLWKKARRLEVTNVASDFLSSGMRALSDSD